jgi:molybdopterin-guanine dinucleotide biosynthesis protein A
MAATTHRLCLVLACDLPNLTVNLIQAVLKSVEGADAVIPRTSDGRIHPLAAAYSRSCHLPLDEYLRQGYCTVHSFLKDSSFRVVWLDLMRAGFADSVLHNINNPCDLEGCKGLESGASAESARRE